MTVYALGEVAPQFPGEDYWIAPTAAVMGNVKLLKNASVWFCGPAGFGQALRADLTAQGLPDDAFHQELFQMR